VGYKAEVNMKCEDVLVWMSRRFSFAVQVRGEGRSGGLVFVNELVSYDDFMGRLRDAMNKLRRRGWRIREDQVQSAMQQGRDLVEMLGG
jgi:hypothetical protein